MTYEEACRIFDEYAKDIDKFYCWGCGSPYNLEHHHVISRQDCHKIGMPELITDFTNFFLLCHDCHHNKWHDGGVKDWLELNNLDAMLDIYKMYYPQKYELLKMKIDEYKESKMEV